MTALNIPNQISWELKELKAGESLEIQGNEIITVVSGRVYDDLKGELKTFESSVYYRGSLQAKEDSFVSIFSITDREVILDKINVDDIFGEFCRDNWTKLCELPGCESLISTDLYRGSSRLGVSVNKV